MNNNMVAQPQTTEQPVRITSPAEAKLFPSLGLWASGHPPALAASPDSSWRSATALISQPPFNHAATWHHDDSQSDR